MTMHCHFFATDRKK